MVFLLFIFALPVLAFIAAVVLALVGLSKGGLRAAAVGMFVATDWHDNSEVRLRVRCVDARGDRLAAGDRRTVMHLDGTSLELDATGYCKLLDPHQDFRENDAAKGALMRRLVA